MAIPVMICTMPSAMAPMRIIRVSSKGVNRAGRVKSPPVVSLTTWVRKSPKKPPVRAPMIKVLMPQRVISPNRFPAVPLGAYFLLMRNPARNISRP